MREATLRRSPVENNDDSRPAAFLARAIESAMTNVLNDQPDAPVELAPGIYVRSGYLCGAVAPEALERAKAYVRQEVEPQSLRADVVERIRPYTL